jgi:hypothetical protein
MTDDRMADGLEHLQAAALEMIRAARAFLDVAEDLVTDPDRVTGTLATVATLVDGAAGRSPRRRDRAGDERDATGGDDLAEVDETYRLRRIDLS